MVVVACRPWQAAAAAVSTAVEQQQRLLCRFPGCRHSSLEVVLVAEKEEEEEEEQEKPGEQQETTVRFPKHCRDCASVPHPLCCM
mmetsp:Transcript_26027/g.66010  ORF Transcript_26027/g.66010 Transcript_26027/m.66010 type:complete len:85 (+) Transcript_26027:510-764(+)